jgi:hypothetical protein
MLSGASEVNGDKWGFYSRVNNNGCTHLKVTRETCLKVNCSEYILLFHAF